MILWLLIKKDFQKFIVSLWYKEKKNQSNVLASVTNYY